MQTANKYAKANGGWGSVIKSPNSFDAIWADASRDMGTNAWRREATRYKGERDYHRHNAEYLSHERDTWMGISEKWKTFSRRLLVWSTFETVAIVVLLIRLFRGPIGN